MEIVENLILYQIATDKNYKVGDSFMFGDNLNFQAERILNGAKTKNKKEIVINGFGYLEGKNKLKHKKQAFVELLKLSDEYDFIVRELAVEQVRLEKFCNYPSRLKCMFLTDNKEAVLNNLKMFYKKGHGKTFQAIAVLLNGKIHKVTNNVLLRTGSSFNEYKTFALKYWGEQDLKQPIVEILFEGNAKIVEIFEEYKIKNS